MSEQSPQPSEADREHSGGDPRHDPTQDAPEVAERETSLERDDEEEDSDDG